MVKQQHKQGISKSENYLNVIFLEMFDYIKCTERVARWRGGRALDL